jgi:hypothetical protein
MEMCDQQIDSLVKFVERKRESHGDTSDRESADHQSVLPREIRMVAALSIPLSPLASPRSDPASLSPRLQVRPYLLGGDLCQTTTEKLSARIVKDSAGCKLPTFVELDPDTDLNIPPPGWLQGHNAKPAASDMALVERASSHLTGALADLRIAQDEPDPDFIASSSIMKTIFSLPFSNSSVTVAVHRVDNSLILQGLINGEVEGECEIHENAPKVQKPQKELSSCKKKRKGPDCNALYNRFMYYSVSNENGVEPLVESEIGEGLVRENRCEREASDESTHLFRRAIHFQFHHLGYIRMYRNLVWLSI